MKLVVLGGGGFRVPLIHGKVLADPRRPVDELVLHDVDEFRLAAITAVLDHQAHSAAWRPRLHTTTSLDEALTGADVVFSAIRVGGLDGRAQDERIALNEGLIGQETVGPGGVCYALRTLPVAMHIARRVAELAPRAWLLNFTNPAGVITEAMSSVLGDRVIGICDSPAGLCRRVATALGLDHGSADVRFDYVGLNHLGWLRRVLVSDVDILPELLADDAALASFEEGSLFAPEWLRAIGAIPNEYLHHFYYSREIIAASRGRTRGEFLLAEQRDFYRRARDNPDAALRIWREVRLRREQSYLAEARDVANAGERSEQELASGGYEDIALRLMSTLTAVNTAAEGGDSGSQPATPGRATAPDKTSPLGNAAVPSSSATEDAAAHTANAAHAAAEDAREDGDVLILNVRNRGAIPNFDEHAVVEVPCRVGATGTHPIATTALDGHMAAQMTAIKTVERDTIAAARDRSRARALRAIAGHPLVDSVPAATRTLDAYAATFPELTDFAP